VNTAALLNAVRAALAQAGTRLEDLSAIADRLGVRLFIVGGPVRDGLLGRSLRDLDLLVEGDAGAFARGLVRARGGRLQLHPEFRTAKWWPADIGLDLAGTRREVYAAPGALPTVIAADLDADLLRRDFTVNAIALALSGPRIGALIDPLGGARDLALERLVTLHPRSFWDDPTRMFRAARLGARLGLSLSDDSRGQLVSARAGGALARISLQRVGAELDRIFHERAPMPAWALCRAWGLPGSIHPALTDVQPSRMLEAGARLAALGGPSLPPEGLLWRALSDAVPPSERLALAALAPRGRAGRSAWLAPGSTPQMLAAISAATRPSEVGWLLKPLTPAARAGLLLGGEPSVDGWLAWWERQGRAQRTVVDGGWLLAAGIAQGPAVGRALRAAQAAAWDGAAAEEQRQAALAAGRG